MEKKRNEVGFTGCPVTASSSLSPIETGGRSMISGRLLNPASPGRLNPAVWPTRGRARPRHHHGAVGGDGVNLVQAAQVNHDAHVGLRVAKC